MGDERRLVERTFTTSASAAASWSHLTAVEGWPSWARHIRRVTLTPPGDLTSESRGRLLLGPGVPSTFRMTRLHADPTGHGGSWAWRGRVAGMTVDYDHLVEPDPAGARITFTIDGSGPTVAVVGPAFAAAYGRIIDRAIPLLVAELDALT